MACNAFPKQPNEKYSVAIDYTDELTTGETVSSTVITAAEVATGDDATATVIDSTTNSTTTATAVVKAGTSGLQYKFTYVTTTSLGYVLEDETIMTVKDK